MGKVQEGLWRIREGEWDVLGKHLHALQLLDGGHRIAVLPLDLLLQLMAMEAHRHHHGVWQWISVLQRIHGEDGTDDADGQSEDDQESCTHGLFHTRDDGRRGYRSAMSASQEHGPGKMARHVLEGPCVNPCVPEAASGGYR